MCFDQLSEDECTQKLVKTPFLAVFNLLYLIFGMAAMHSPVMVFCLFRAIYLLSSKWFFRCTGIWFFKSPIYYTYPDYASKKEMEERYFFTNNYNQMIFIHLVRVLPFPAIISLLVSTFMLTLESGAYQSIPHRLWS